VNGPKVRIVVVINTDTMNPIKSFNTKKDLKGILSMLLLNPMGFLEPFS
jgi:hypothetical protein